MKKYILPVFLSSIISAVLAVALFAYWIPREIIIEEEKIAKQVKNDILYSKRMDSAFNSAAPNDFISAANNSLAAVVFINSLTDKDQQNKFTRRFNSSTGSGVIISPDGYIVTNQHVINDAEVIEVMLNNNQEYKAKVIGEDPTTDLALLKIEATNLDYLVFGNSDSLQIGEWVMAIGNPFRLQSTVTAGIVSAKARGINILSQQGIESFIQTDAAVNPGNSGGALINTRGDLLGINSAIMSNSGKYEGYSFAIPSNLAKKIVYDIKEFGAVQRGWLGITIINVNAAIAKDLGVTEIEGVFLELVSKDGAAKEGGLQRKDLLTHVNGFKTSSVPEFMEQVARYRPGDNIKISYTRNGQKRNTQVTLRNQLNTTDYIAVRKDKILTNLGFELRDLDQKESKRLNSKGAFVVSIYSNSTIESTNMEPGFIITSINNTSINSTQDLISFLSENKGTMYIQGFYEKYPGEYPYTFLNK